MEPMVIIVLALIALVVVAQVLQWVLRLIGYAWKRGRPQNNERKE